jgi:GDPmannose 4,6-dehydratase
VDNAPGDEPEGFVIASGESHTAREFVQLAFERVGLDWQRHVQMDPRYFRPAEVASLCGDPSKARADLGWEVRTSFEELVALIVDGDVRLLDDELAGDWCEWTGTDDLLGSAPTLRASHLRRSRSAT